MQRAEDQVTRFGGGDGGFNGLAVAHLADQYHVGVLAQGRAQAGGEAHGVLADFALVDRALVGGVDVFHRVLQRDDVGLAGVVDEVQQRRKGGGLAAARLAGDQHDALVQVRQLHRRRGQAEGVQLGYAVGEQAQRRRGRALLAEDMYAQAVAGVGVGGVQLAGAQVFVVGLRRARQLPGVGHAVGEGQGGVVHVLQLAVLAVLGRQAQDQVNVRRAILAALQDQLLNGHFHVAFPPE